MKGKLIKVINSLARFVGFSSKTIGVPKRAIFLKEWIIQSCNSGSVKKINLTDSIQQSEIPPHTIANVYPSIISNEFNRTINETFVLEIKGGRVWGRNGAVIMPDDFLLTDVSREFGKYKGVYGNEHPIFRRIFLGRLKIIKARIAVIATAGASNFYHWMIDIIPRIGLLQQAGLLSSIDFFIIDFSELSYQRETLSAIGINESKIISSSDPWKFHVQAEVLLVPSLVSELSTVNNLQAKFLRSIFPPIESGGRECKIYISRSLAKTRKLLNQESITSWLLGNGFEIVYPEELSIKEFVEIMNRASWVIAPEGAGLTNVVFCKPGVKIINLCPYYQVNPIYWLLANSIGGSYGYLISEEKILTDKHDPVINKKSFNFEIDLADLKLLYKQMS